jgi:hypothetical protein
MVEREIQSFLFSDVFSPAGPETKPSGGEKIKNFRVFALWFFHVPMSPSARDFGECFLNYRRPNRRRRYGEGEKPELPVPPRLSREDSKHRLCQLQTEKSLLSRAYFLRRRHDLVSYFSLHRCSAEALIRSVTLRIDGSFPQTPRV